MSNDMKQGSWRGTVGRRLFAGAATMFAMMGASLTASAAVVGNGTFEVRSASSNLCLSITGSSLVDGAKVIQDTCNGSAIQRFLFSVQSDGSYQIVNVASGKALDVTDVSTANGALIQQWAAGGGGNQHFAATVNGNGYTLAAKNSGKCVDVKDLSTSPGAAIQQWACGGGANQRWLLN
ncbi:MAG: hypothetical protein JWL63_1789, partial [Rhodocyclales bacterium]|nr:hypothetical protein [Rhodocyclales bacterium]